MNPENAPPGWGRDKLSEFIGATHGNTLAYFRDAKDLWQRLLGVDDVFRDAAENLNESPSWFVGFFLVHTHAAYRGAVRMATSGQLAPAYMVMRGCLENALYGLFVDSDPAIPTLWLRRDESEEMRKKVRGTFSIGAVMRHLAAKHPSLGDDVRGLYDFTIRLGAHPNSLGLTTVTKMEETGSGITFSSASLVGPGPALQGCVLTVARVGIVALEVFGLVFKQRFEILGLADRLRALRNSDQKLEA